MCINVLYFVLGFLLIFSGCKKKDHNDFHPWVYQPEKAVSCSDKEREALIDKATTEYHFVFYENTKGIENSRFCKQVKKFIKVIDDLPEDIKKDYLLLQNESDFQIHITDFAKYLFDPFKNIIYFKINNSKAIILNKIRGFMHCKKFLNEEIERKSSRDLSCFMSRRFIKNNNGISYALIEINWMNIDAGTLKNIKFQGINTDFTIGELPKQIKTSSYSRMFYVGIINEDYYAEILISGETDRGIVFSCDILIPGNKNIY